MKQELIAKKIEWKDLVKMNHRQIFIENTITLPWLISSWTLAAYGQFLIAIPCSFMFFLTALRQVHNGFHMSLGMGKTGTRFMLYLNSALMLVSAHAVKFSHLRHHKYCLGANDHEGQCARMQWYRAILYGPKHIFTIHRVALQLGNKIYKRDVMLELSFIAIFIFISFITGSQVLIYHCLVIAAGELFSAFFAVWTVHHDLEEGEIARTQRKGWKNFIT